MKILVTGGAGFLGSHLSERLLRDGHGVICVDNFVTGNMQNILHLINEPGFELIRHDITIPLDVDADAIYNLACPASPAYYQTHPIQTIQINVIGTINMLELARRLDVKILQASTSEVYGDPVIHPQPESYNGNVNPIGVRACYDEGKRCAEALFFSYHLHHNVRIKVLRIFNTYGPRMQVCDGRVVSNFIIQALKGDDITIYGEGKQTRSFCYVDDLIEGMIKMMNSREDFTGPVNIGNPDEYPIMELADRIIGLTGSKSKFIFKPLPGDDPSRRQPVIDLVKKELSWEPLVHLDEGLKKSIEYFQSFV
jgi:UDP-glucuronate decarboxylase